MTMTRNEVCEQVIECLYEISNGNSAQMDEKTNPMLQLGLDSHDGVNLACKLTEALHYDIPKEINPLVDDERNRPRSVGEITDLVLRLLMTRKDENHD